ncbi:MAG: DUF4199 domain-containing protein [Cytophagaceae bacterium]|jgi:hypothetical protein|nr:DUF4199 domain-containing protein [Cytophagaceae bacterium]
MINKTALIFAGLIGGIIGGLNMLTNEFVLSSNGTGKSIVTVLSFACWMVLLFYGMKTYRHEFYKGEANFGQMFLSGIVLSLLSVVLIAVLAFVYFQIIRPDFKELVRPVIETAMKADKASSDKINQELKLLDEGYSVPNAIMGAIVYSIIVMLCISVVLSAILRTKDTFTENPA